MMTTLDNFPSKNKKITSHIAKVNYKSIFETLLDTFYRVDADGFIVIVSPSVVDLLGYSPEELIGTKLAELYSEADGREKFLQKLQESGGEIRGYETELRHKNGSPVWVATSSNYYRDEDGNIIGIEGVARDITLQKQGESALNEAQMDLNDAQRIAQVGSWELNLVTGLLTWSDEIFNIFEVDKQTFKASYEAFLEAIHPDDREMVNAAYLRSLESRQPYSVLHRLKMEDGRIKWVQERCESRFDEDGKPLSSRGTVQDITNTKNAEKNAKESEVRLKEILNIAPEAVITVDADMRISMFNQSAERIFGYATEEVLGQSADILMPACFREGHQRQVEAFDNSGHTYRPMDHRREITGLKKDGTEFPATASVSKLEIDGEKLFTVMMRDITERKRTEAMLLEAHEELERKIKDRTAELSKARDEADAANTAKSHIITTMSHELRTPLTSIVGSLRLLAHDHVELDAKEKANMIDVGWRNSNLLASLVDKIVNVERLESGTIALEKQHLDLAELMQEAVELNGGYAMEKQVNLVFAGSASSGILEGDRMLLLQVMANLISNACKFSPSGGTVVISLKQNGSEADISVSDDGPGIPDDLRDTIFDKYVRGENIDSRNAGGAGLGLSITKSIVELHDGAIGFNSNLGAGTTFIVTLPIVE